MTVEMPPLGMIVAMARDRVIGREGGLPWHVPEDLKHFRRVTTGHAVIMGRATWESIGRPLPGRRMIVVSRREAYAPEGVEVFATLDAAIAAARTTDPMPIVIGGAQIYAAALPYVTKIWLTELDRDVDGDARLPELPPGAFREVSRACGDTEGVTFIELERVRQ